MVRSEPEKEPHSMRAFLTTQARASSYAFRLRFTTGSVIERISCDLFVKVRHARDIRIAGVLRRYRGMQYSTISIEDRFYNDEIVITSIKATNATP